jgi:hypothetical protein
MKKLFTTMITFANNAFFTALCMGCRALIRLALANPFLTHAEKQAEVMRLCKIVFRFDNGRYTLADMIEARDLVRVVPEGHFAYAVARKLSDY